MKNKVNKICNQLLKLSSTGLLLLIAGFSVPIHAADFPQAGNFSNGSKVWADTCSRCHNMRGPQELRDDQWITTAFHMRIRAGLTGQETRDVITFLQTSNSKMEAVDATQTLQ